MLRRIWLPTFLAVAILAQPTAFAAESMYEGDPQKELKDDIEAAYGLYILNPSRRNPKEKVEIKGETAEMYLYWDPRKSDPDKLKCDALKWLLLGRFGKGGAQNFFQQLPKFQAAQLHLFRLNSTRTVDAAGKYTVTKTPQEIAKLNLTRKKAEKTDWNKVKADFAKFARPDADYAACVKTTEKHIDARWYNKEYFK